MEHKNNWLMILMLVLLLAVVTAFSIYFVYLTQGDGIQRTVAKESKEEQVAEEPAVKEEPVAIREILWDDLFFYMPISEMETRFPGTNKVETSPYSFTDFLMLDSPNREGLAYFKLLEPYKIANVDFKVTLIFKNELLYQVKLETILAKNDHYETAWLVYRLLETKYGPPQNIKPLKQSDFTSGSSQASLLNCHWESGSRKIMFYTGLDESSGINLMYSINDEKLWIENEASRV